MQHSLNLKSIAKKLKFKGCAEMAVYFKLRDMFAGAYTRMTQPEYKLTIKAIQAQADEAIAHVKEMADKQKKESK